MHHAGEPRAASLTIPRPVASCGRQPARRLASATLSRPCSLRDLRDAMRVVSGGEMRQTVRRPCGQVGLGETGVGKRHAAHRWPNSSKNGRAAQTRKSTKCSTIAVSFVSSEKARCEKVPASPDDSRIAKPASYSSVESAPEQKGVMRRERENRGATHGWPDCKVVPCMYDQFEDGEKG